MSPKKDVPADAKTKQPAGFPGGGKADKLGTLLRDHFELLKDEPLPDELTALIDRLDALDKRRK